MMMQWETNMEDLNRFNKLIEQFEEKFGKFDAKVCLRCIEIARNEMKSGKFSEENFMKAKNILLNAVRCEGFYSN